MGEIDQSGYLPFGGQDSVGGRFSRIVKGEM
jgi:hypothetical protein